MINKFVYEQSLHALERLDAKKTLIQKISYKVWRKVFDMSFKNIYKYSPYDYERNGEINE